MINQHLVELADGIGCPYTFLSNDNGFIGRWGNRTLLARFGAVRSFDDGQSHHKPQIVSAGDDVSFPPFEMIKKPVLNAMTMLSLLGDERCAVGVRSIRTPNRV